MNMTAKSTSTPPTAIIDTLNALLEAEQNSVFRFVEAGSPYLSRAAADIRNPLIDMIRAGERHAMELAALIEGLGGIPLPGGIQPEEQYLAFLTLKFLLPKLLEAKQVTIQRYENALSALIDAPADVTDVLKSHLAEHRAHVTILGRRAS